MPNVTGIKKLLIKHYKTYPEMQIVDMVKLLYQNEFAGGHLIEDEQKSLGWLTEEWNSLTSYPYESFEDIGNGLARCHLSPVRDTGIEISTINRFFVNTANSVKGNIASFEDKLNVLLQMCKSEQLPLFHGGSAGLFG